MPRDSEHSLVFNVISRGIASGGDSCKERQRYLRGPHESAVINVESSSGRKRPKKEEAISFFEKNQGNVKGSHDDVIVLWLKINNHRIELILVDTGSSADIMYLSTFKQIGYKVSDLGLVRTPLRGFTGDTLH